MKKNLQTKFSTRQKMLSKDFELYYYSDRELERVESHTHDYYEFYFFLEGNVELVIDGTAYKPGYGDVILIPPGTMHQVKVLNQEKEYRRFVFWIRRTFMEQLTERSEAYGYLNSLAEMKKQFIFKNDLMAASHIQFQIMQLIEEMQSERFGKEEKIPICVQELLLHLNRMVYEKNHPEKPKETKSLYQILVSYIEANLEKDLTLEELADEFFVSKYHIAHVFKEKMGMSLHQYIIKKRLEACREAMRGGETITTIYKAYGFKDYSAFYRAFKKEYGMTPKAFRK